MNFEKSCTVPATKCSFIACRNVNDEILVADIEPKEKAQKKFTNAVRRGQTAATVEAR